MTVDDEKVLGSWVEQCRRTADELSEISPTNVDFSGPEDFFWRLEPATAPLNV